MKNNMRFSSYQVHHIMQVYIDKLSNGEDKKKMFQDGNPASADGKTVAKAGSPIIAERIIKDIAGRINNICNSGVEQKKCAGKFSKNAVSDDGKFSAFRGGAFQTSEIEPASGICKDKEEAVCENKNYVYNFIDESGKKISREVSPSDSEFLIKKT